MYNILYTSTLDTVKIIQLTKPYLHIRLTTQLQTIVAYCSHTKYVSKLQGESFHLRPLPSRFHSSIQFSSSPFSYRKLFGSPAFQLVNVIGFPVAIQKKLPSSAKSVPDVQKCSLPNPNERTIEKQLLRKLWAILCHPDDNRTESSSLHSMNRM